MRQMHISTKVQSIKDVKSKERMSAAKYREVSRLSAIRLEIFREIWKSTRRVSLKL